ncbi:MAG: DUF2934 domain-containing protein [Nitrospiraceae bacterium]|nr:DUF2934 domain-containing protein [Nitrospiraceae bacterium]
MDKNKLQEEIARVAYELFEKRGCVPGYHVEDWIEAERTVTARYSKQKPAPEKAAKAAVAKTSGSLKPKGAAASAKTRPAAAKKTTGKKKG